MLRSLVILYAALAFAGAGHEDPVPQRAAAQPDARYVELLTRECDLAAGRVDKDVCRCGTFFINPFREACIEGKIVTDPTKVAEFRDARRYPARVPDVAEKNAIETSIKYFKTCETRFCEKSYNCQCYTRDFCDEWKKIGGGYCVGFGFGCRKGDKVGPRHRIALVAIGRPFTHSLCLIEPQDNSVITCWPSKTVPTDFEMHPPEHVIHALSVTNDWYKKCAEGGELGPNLLTDPIDAAGYGRDHACCECRFGHYVGGGPVKTGRSQFCTGQCAAAGATFVRRVRCE